VQLKSQKQLRWLEANKPELLNQLELSESLDQSLPERAPRKPKNHGKKLPSLFKM
jgi:hypothetical protein